VPRLSQEEMHFVKGPPLRERLRGGRSSPIGNGPGALAGRLPAVSPPFPATLLRLSDHLGRWQSQTVSERLADLQTWITGGTLDWTDVGWADVRLFRQGRKT